VPDAELLQGGGQEVLAWGVLALIALYVCTVSYFIKRQNKFEEKYDQQNDKMLKLAIRSQRAIEVLADIEDLNE